MALTPPNPGFQAKALSIVRQLSWSPIAGDVGELVGGWLALACSAEGRAVWCAGEGDPVAGLAPRHVAKDAFAAMKEGDIGKDGAITWHGQRYRLADVLDAGRMVARLVGEAVAA